MYGNAAHERLVESADWNEPLDLHEHRYVREDVLLGLGLQVSLARHLGVPAPVSEGLLAIVSAFTGAAPGRTLADLGLGHLGPEELRDLLAFGRTGSR